MHASTYSTDEIAHAVDVVSAVVEDSINTAPSAAVVERLLATRVLLQSFRPAFAPPLRTIQIEE